MGVLFLLRCLELSCDLKADVVLIENLEFVSDQRNKSCRRVAVFVAALVLFEDVDLFSNLYGAPGLSDDTG